MHFFSSTTLSLVTIAAAAVFILPAHAQSGCDQVLTRKEWRTLYSHEKETYLYAVLRLQKSASSNDGDAGVGLFARIHEQYGQQGIHSTPMFLPWHRHFTRQYELALRKLTPKAVQHYWDASLDHEDFWSAPVFRSKLGFGGMGAAPNGCITDGPFKHFKPYNWTCLERSTNRTAFVTPPALVNNVIANNARFWDFAQPLDAGFHISVHLAVGGIMGRSFLSPNDPIFFAHHANVDRLWAIWQLQAPGRLTDYGGPRNDPQIDFLTSRLIGYDDVTVSDVMSIRKLCYRYDDVQLPGTRSPVMLKATPRLSQRSEAYEEGAEEAEGGGGMEVERQKTVKEQCDLGELVSFHHLARIPDSTIQMHGMDAKVVRQFEAEQNHLIDELNVLPGFVSPSCMLNRPRVLLDKIRQNPCRKLTCTIRGKRVPIEVGRSAEETLANVLQISENMLRGERKPSVKTLSAVIGKPSFGSSTLYNPFGACRK